MQPGLRHRVSPTPNLTVLFPSFLSNTQVHTCVREHTHTCMHTHYCYCCFWTMLQTYAVWLEFLFLSYFLSSSLSLSLESVWFLHPLFYLTLISELGCSQILVVEWTHPHRSLLFKDHLLEWSPLGCSWLWLGEKQGKSKRPFPLHFAPSLITDSSNWATHTPLWSFKVSLYQAHPKANTQALE